MKHDFIPSQFSDNSGILGVRVGATVPTSSVLQERSSKNCTLEPGDNTYQRVFYRIWQNLGALCWNYRYCDCKVEKGDVIAILFVSFVKSFLKMPPPPQNHLSLLDFDRIEFYV